jgi:hypothetical protein
MWIPQGVELTKRAYGLYFTNMGYKNRKFKLQNKKISGAC